MISAIAAVGIAGAAILIYQYPSSLGNRDIKIFFRNDCQYDGDFNNNFREGDGVYSCPDGTKYDGEWKNDLPHGDGLMTYADGSNYRGLSEAGLRHGLGSMTYADDSKYSGEWKSDRRHGLAMKIDADGNIKIDANGNGLVDCWINDAIFAESYGVLPKKANSLEDVIVENGAYCPS